MRMFCGYYVQFIKNNAIEAISKCRGDKIIKLKIVIEDNNAIISVKNTYENAVIYENGEISDYKDSGYR